MRISLRDKCLIIVDIEQVKFHKCLFLWFHQYLWIYKTHMMKVRQLILTIQVKLELIQVNFLLPWHFPCQTLHHSLQFCLLLIPLLYLFLHWFLNNWRFPALFFQRRFLFGWCNCADFQQQIIFKPLKLLMNLLPLPKLITRTRRLILHKPHYRHQRTPPQIMLNKRLCHLPIKIVHLFSQNLVFLTVNFGQLFTVLFKLKYHVVSYNSGSCPV